MNQHLWQRPVGSSIEVAISVLVATYERARHLELCLTALNWQDCAHPFEIIVVDDGGEDDDSLHAVRMAENLPRPNSIRYVWHPHRGFGLSRCRNEGAKLARGELLWFIDSDILLNPHALSAGWQLYQDNPHRVIGGHYHYLPAMAITRLAVRKRWDSVNGGKEPLVDIDQGAIPEPGYDVREDWFHQGRLPENVFQGEQFLYRTPFNLLGGNILVPRHIWETTQGFDESFVTYGGEDAEFSVQVADAGWRFSYSKLAGGAHMAHTKNPQATTIGEMIATEYIADKWPEWFPDGKPSWKERGWVHPHWLRCGYKKEPRMWLPRPPWGNDWLPPGRWNKHGEHVIGYGTTGVTLTLVRERRTYRIVSEVPK